MKFRRRPFTLLEVLIASTIFLGLAIVLFVYAGQTTQSWSKLQVRRNQLNELLALDRAIDTVLPNIIPFTWPDPEEETITETPVGGDPCHPGEALRRGRVRQSAAGQGYPAERGRQLVPV